ncbi:hypothetical protein ACHAPO_003551 [Fusarium lateritium]
MGYNSTTSGLAQVPAKAPAPANGTSTSSAGDASSGYESGMSSFENTCNKNRSLKCTKACCKGKAKAKDRRVKIVTSSEVASSENAEDAKSAEDETTDLDTAVKYTKPSIEDPNWSISEDYRLRAMKEAGESWKFITDSLCKSKNDVRARWNILQSQTIASKAASEPETGEATTEPETCEATTEPETDEATTEPETGDASTESVRAAAKVASGDEITSGAKTSDRDEDSEESSENEESGDTDGADEQVQNTKKRSNSVPNSKGKTHTKTIVNNKWHRGTRNHKVAIENKWAKARAKAKANDNDESPMESGQEASDGSSEVSSRLEYVDPEKREQMKYLHGEIYQEMYPADIHPQPDAYLNERDCALLSTIDSKYKRSRWLEMQANFYNVTGRMVPLEAIRDRCERAEAEKEARSEARKLQRRIEKVENWMDGQLSRE